MNALFALTLLLIPIAVQPPEPADYCMAFARVFIDYDRDGAKDSYEPWAGPDIPIAYAAPGWPALGLTTDSHGRVGNQVWTPCADAVVWTATWQTGRELVSSVPLLETSQPTLLPLELPHVIAGMAATNCSIAVIVFTDIDGDGEFGLLDVAMPGADVRFDGTDHDITLATNADGAASIAAKCQSSWRVSYPHGMTTLQAGMAAVAELLPGQPWHTFMAAIRRFRALTRIDTVDASQ